MKTSKILWATGLSGAGKSTLAEAVAERLADLNISSAIVDGDEFRKTHCADLGFTAEDRMENLARMSIHVNKLSKDYDVVFVAAITPFSETRKQLRAELGEKYVEVFLNTPLSVCQSRDPKGLYARANNGDIPNFTGISSPYDKPESPDIVINHDDPLNISVGKLLAFLDLTN